MNLPQITKFRTMLYPISIWVVVHPNITKTIDFVEDLINTPIHMKIKMYRAYTFTYTEENGRQIIMIFLKPNAKPGEVIHEVKHVLNFIFSWHGVKLSTSNDEHECYYLEYLTNKVHNILNKYKKPHKRVKITPEESIYQIP